MDSPKLKKLKAEWDKKLADSGFEDAEYSGGRLKTWASFEHARDFDANVFEAKETYYRLAGQFLHEYEFKNDIERDIWAQHADGVSIRNIFTLLKNQGRHTYRDGIEATIKRLAKEMKKRGTYS